MIDKFLSSEDEDDKKIKEDLARLMFHMTPLDQFEGPMAMALAATQQKRNAKRLRYLTAVWQQGWIEKRGPWRWVQRAPKIWDHSSWFVFLEEFFYQLPLMDGIIDVVVVVPHSTRPSLVVDA